jgi:hypothetical protein
MSNVGRDLRVESLAAAAAKSTDERILEALALGDEAIAVFAEVNGVTRREAEQILRRNRQKGRRRSKCMMD